MDQADAVADLRKHAVVAAKLSQDLRTVAGVLEEIGCADLARKALALDVVELLALPPEEGVKAFAKITASLEQLHSALAKYTASRSSRPI